ncbi:ankyrin repeat-containing domain protein [Usnea florida]
MSERGPDRNPQLGGYGLVEAATAGNTDLVNSLLDSGVDLNIREDEGLTALPAAASNAHLDMVKLLLDRGADVNIHHGNALQAVARNGHLDIVKLLLDRGADVNIQDPFGGNALQKAAYWGHLDIVKLLLDRGADVNIQCEHHGNALEAAVSYGYLDIIKQLLDHGADVNTQGEYHSNALQAAVVTGRTDTVRLLLERGADVTVQPNSVTRHSLLHVAIASKNLDLLIMLCDAGAVVHLSSQDDSGRTPLHVAVDDGQIEIAKYLLGRGASPDIEDFGDINPFQLAMRNENRDMVLLLYPVTTAGLSSISASDWRRCSGHGPDCSLELISDRSAKVVFRDESLKQDLWEMSYPLSSEREEIPTEDTEFMHRHRNGKRIFIIPDGSMLYPKEAIDIHCRWWCKEQLRRVRPWWIVRIKTAPSLNAVRQARPEDCYLECALCFTCYALPENMEDWPNDVQLTGNPFGESESRQGIMWIMMKTQASEDYSHPRKPVLQSRIFFSTSEYAEVPKMATDLLPPLVKKVQTIWEQNFHRFQKRFGLMRAKILRSSGTNPNVIQELLNDAQLLEILRENLTKQIDTLQKFRYLYQSESWRALHELPLDEVKRKMLKLERASIELQRTAEKLLRGLTESSQNMIQLVSLIPTPHKRM